VSTLFGINFYSGNKQSFVELLDNHLSKEEKKFIVTANPEILMHTHWDSAYKTAISSANYVVADGIGVVKAMDLMKEPVDERVTGIDIMIDLLEIANKKNLSIYFLGASEQSINKMMDTIYDQYPNLLVAGFHHGFFTESDQIIEEIQAQRPDLIFVAMGAPKQEAWIANNIDKFDKGVFIGVGGSFDVLSGEQKRSPRYLQNMHLEWLYRITFRPNKLKKIQALSLFSLLTIREYINMLWLKDSRVEE
jgi:N-acetylglucosaminyldiphosphoundecaprenol N-acetyl-beta-D-mannosaminyltransferase